MPDPIIVTGGPAKLEPPRVVSYTPETPETPGPKPRPAGRLVRAAVALLRMAVGLVFRALGALIARYPRHALAAALSLVMLAAIAYTQQRDGRKPPLNQVKSEAAKNAKKEPSVVKSETPPAKPDVQVDPASHTELSRAGPPPPVVIDEKATQASQPEAPVEPAPKVPEPAPPLSVASALPAPRAPDPQPATGEPLALPAPTIPQADDLGSLTPIEAESPALALASSEKKPGDDKGAVPDPSPVPSVAAAPNGEPPPISPSGEPGPLFSAAETKPEDRKKPDELKKPEPPAPTPITPPAALPNNPIPPPKAEVPKSDPPMPDPVKGLDPPTSIIPSPDPIKLPEPSKPEPVKLPEPSKPEPVKLPEPSKPEPIKLPEPSKPEPAKPPEPAPIVTAERPVEEPRPEPPAMPAGAAAGSVEIAEKPKRDSRPPSDPALAGWKELPNLGKVPVETGEDQDAVAEPGEQAAGVAAAAAHDPRAHVARDLSFELEAEAPKAREPKRSPAVGERIEATLHVVERRENFWTISRLYYGSGRYYKALWKANAEKCPRIEELRVGDVIVIPAPEDLDASLFERPATRTAAAPRAPSNVRRAAVDEDLVLPPARRTSVSRRALEDRDEPEDSESTSRAAARPRDTAADVDRPRRATYKVRPGDTLRSIARDTLGSSRRAGEILDLNSGLVDESGRLTAGQLIALPDDARRK